MSGKEICPICGQGGFYYPVKACGSQEVKKMACYIHGHDAECSCAPDGMEFQNVIVALMDRMEKLEQAVFGAVEIDLPADPEGGGEPE